MYNIKSMSVLKVDPHANVSGICAAIYLRTAFWRGPDSEDSSWETQKRHCMEIMPNASALIVDTIASAY